MLQVYPFHGTDVQEVYAKLNSFLQELAIIDILVAQDAIRANTKYYPDWDRTATTIEVCVDYSTSPAPHEVADQVRELHHAVSSSQQLPAEQDETPVAVPAGDPFDPFLDSDEALS